MLLGRVLFGIITFFSDPSAVRNGMYSGLTDGDFMHLYIVVDCKTQDCRTVHVLMHLGEKGKTPEKVVYWMSYPLMVDCPSCGETYDYADGEERFWQKELPPPPPGYSDRLAPSRFKTRFLQTETDAFTDSSSQSARGPAPYSSKDIPKL